MSERTHIYPNKMPFYRGVFFGSPNPGKTLKRPGKHDKSIPERHHKRGQYLRMEFGISMKLSVAACLKWWCRGIRRRCVTTGRSWKR